MCRYVPLCATLFLAACVTGSDWEIFSDRSFNITFAYPPSFVRDEAILHDVLEFGETPIDADSITLREGLGESAIIRVTQSKNPLLIAYLSDNSVSTQWRMLPDGEVQMFTQEGMGSPVHYLFRKGENYIVLSFVFPPSQAEMDRTLQSAVLR